MSEPNDDESSAAGAQTGDSAAFDLIARQHQAILLRFVRRNFPNIHDPEDIVQESLLRAFENIGKYQTAWPLKGWLLTITYRMAISHIRHRNSNTRLIARLHNHAVMNMPTPSDAIANRDEAQNLWNTAAKLLTPTQFHAAWLLYAEDMSRDDIAKILGKTRPTTKLILYRATRKLRSHFTASAKMPTRRSEDSRVAPGVLL